MNSEQALTALGEGIRATGSPACQQTDPEAWFPEGGTPSPNKNSAVMLCKACPVQMLCLQFAMINNEQHGIWGGLNSRQRGRLRKANKARVTSL
jgi:WhiB family redox-sensing transcriptional regulator